MRGAEMIVFGFGAPRKSGNTAELAQGGHGLAPAGQDLVGVALVADIPDDAVARGVEHVVQGDRQLDRAQVGGEVAARAGHAVDDEGSQFIRKARQLRNAELAQRMGRIDGFEQGMHSGFSVRWKRAGRGD
ncbi:hypothetical protein D3C72_1337490 [compost metagenome]